MIRDEGAGGSEGNAVDRQRRGGGKSCETLMMRRRRGFMRGKMGSGRGSGRSLGRGERGKSGWRGGSLHSIKKKKAFRPGKKKTPKKPQLNDLHVPFPFSVMIDPPGLELDTVRGAFRETTVPQEIEEAVITQSRSPGEGPSNNWPIPVHQRRRLVRQGQASKEKNGLEAV